MSYKYDDSSYIYAQLSVAFEALELDYSWKDFFLILFLLIQLILPKFWLLILMSKKNVLDHSILLLF